MLCTFTSAFIFIHRIRYVLDVQCAQAQHNKLELKHLVEVEMHIRILHLELIRTGS